VVASGWVYFLEVRGIACLNPLHCGAVVASGQAQPDALQVRMSQSPSLRGSGRFPMACPAPRRPGRVSIPFIAGQWSLHAGAPRIKEVRDLWVSIPFIAGQWSLRMA